jgi:hypothetical protein
VSLWSEADTLDEMLTRWDIRESWGETRIFLNGMSVLEPNIRLKFTEHSILIVLSLPLAAVCTSAKLSVISMVGNECL